MAVEWTAVLLAVLVCLIIILIKFLVWNCIIKRRQDDDTSPILSRREGFWQEYERMRREGQRNREPPPDFDEALRNSRPVSYIEVQEEPPPTYDDFLRSYSTTSSPASTFEDNFVDISIDLLDSHTPEMTQGQFFTVTLDDLPPTISHV